jgi:hypothetical protein
MFRELLHSAPSVFQAKPALEVQGRTCLPSIGIRAEPFFVPDQLALNLL